jgi:hypothetical protein
MTAICISPENAGWGRECEMGRYDAEAARSVISKFRGDVFECFHAVVVKPRSGTEIHILACWDRCFALPHLLYIWRHHSGIFWIPLRVSEHIFISQYIHANICQYNLHIYVSTDVNTHQHMSVNANTR